MKAKKILEFKKIYADTKAVFLKYQIYQIRLESDNAVGNKITDEKRENYQQYIKCINLILQKMNRENANILDQLFIQNKERVELNYSTSNFYIKVKNAAMEFLEFINYDNY